MQIWQLFTVLKQPVLIQNKQEDSGAWSHYNPMQDDGTRELKEIKSVFLTSNKCSYYTWVGSLVTLIAY